MDLVKLINILETNPRALLSMNRDEVAELAGEPIAACIGEKQNSLFHMYDVFEHCVHSVEYTDFKGMYLVAMLYHDCAKPQCRGINKKTGNDTFYNHEVESAKLFKEIFNGMIDETLLNECAFIIEHHDLTMHMVLDHAHENQWNWFLNVPNMKARMKSWGLEVTGESLDIMDRVITACHGDVEAQSAFNYESKHAVVMRCWETIQYIRETL